MSQSFSLKTIRIGVTLGQGVFSEGGDKKIIEGLACDVKVRKPGLPSKNSADISIWGLRRDDMAQLTMLAFKPLESQRNLIEVWAGERGGALPLVFAGEISGATADFNTAPDVCMKFQANSGIYPQQIASPPLTVQGEARADSLFARFAAEAGYAYQNEGVSASVRNAWFSGSPIEKMSKLSRDIGCQLFIDDGLVLVLPAGASRESEVVYLSDASGLIGYPTLTQDGISCRCHFNPALRHNGNIEVQSIAPRASGRWRITKLTHSISAYRPSGGEWESQIEAAYHEQQ